MSTKIRQRRSYTVLALGGLLAGLLIWSKLRLVTDIPRSAYADPKTTAAEDGDAGAEQPQADTPLGAGAASENHGADDEIPAGDSEREPASAGG